MKRLALYILVFLAGIGFSIAQSSNGVTYKLDYQDSVRLVLENTRNVDAIAVGAAIATVWKGLGLDQQAVIKNQLKLMKKKGQDRKSTRLNSSHSDLSRMPSSA